MMMIHSHMYTRHSLGYVTDTKYFYHIVHIHILGIDRGVQEWIQFICSLSVCRVYI